MMLGFVFVVVVVLVVVGGFSTTLTVDMLSFSTKKPGIQTDEEENGGDESVGGTTGEKATAAKRIAKISEVFFLKKNLSTQNHLFSL